MGIITREEWGSTGRRGGSPLKGPLAPVVIHTWAMAATGRTPMTQAKAASWMQSVQAGHRNARRFADIGYNFCVDPHGRIFEGRGWLRSGAHTIELNRAGHGLALMGHGDQQAATPAQWDALRNLILTGQAAGAISEDYTVTGHRDWPSSKGKTCPGNMIYPHIHKLDAGTTFMTAAGEKHYPTTAGDRDLVRGDTGPGVRVLQWVLNTHYSSDLAPDGDFGPLTEAAVRAAQNNAGLIVTGTWGHYAALDTWASLDDALTAATTSIDEAATAVNDAKADIASARARISAINQAQAG